MSDLEKNIKRINDKLQQVLKSHQFLQKENKKQIELIKELENSISNNKSEMIALHEKINILKAAAGKMEETDKKAFEKNINQYIREIEKCISILSI